MADDSLATKLLGGVVGSAAGYVGNLGAQWILSSEFGYTSDNQQVLNDLTSIQGNLKSIEGTVDDLATKFGDFLTAWKNDNDYNNATNYILPNVKDIDTAYDKLTGTTLDTDKNNLISNNYDFGGDLDAINRAMTGQMDVYPNIELLKTVAGVNGTMDPPQSMDQSYSALVAYFETMVKVQTRGLILQLNCDLAQSPPNMTDADAHLKLFRTNLAGQYERFLAAAELLAVLQCGDDKLLDMILGPQTDDSGHVLDPIRAAFDYINDNRLSGDGLFWRIYYWQGSGPSFNTGNQPPPTLIALSGPPNPNIQLKATPVQLVCNANVWNMSRFDLINPPDGVYNVDAIPLPANARLDGADQYVNYGPQQVIIYDDARGGIQPQTCSFSSITGLSLFLGNYIETNYRPSGAFTVEVLCQLQTLGGAVLANGNSTTGSTSSSGHDNDSDTGWWELGVDSSGNVYIQGETPDDSTFGPSTGGLTVTGGDWHYYAVTYDGANLYFGFDGNLVAELTTGAITGTGITVCARVDTTAHTNDNGDTTNKTNVSSKVMATLSELRLWNVATSYEDFADRATVRLGAGNSGLFAVYGFDRGNTAPRHGSSGFTISDSNYTLPVLNNDPPAMDGSDPVGPTISDADAMRAGTRLPIKSRPAPAAPGAPPLLPHIKLTLTPKTPKT